MNVRPIKSCPTTFDLFKSRGRNLGCSVGNEYHCMVNEQKREVEFCLPRSWIQPDHCPEYISFASQIDQYPCNRSKGVCPPIVYWSNTSFSYSGCLRENGIPDVNDQEKESNEVLVPVMISVVTVILLLLVTLCFVLICCVKRRRRNKRGNDEKKTLLQLPLVSLEQLEKGRQIIEEHRNDGTYVPTNAAHKGKEILNKKNILIIKGITGSGKTKTALHIASEWMKEDERTRQCVYLNSIDDHGMLNVKDNTCFILDDCFTRWVLDSSSPFLPELCLFLHTQVKIHTNMHLIITVNEIIFFSHRQMLQKYSLFSKDHEVILNYPDFEERKKILNSHFTKSSDEKTNHLLCATEPHTDKSPRPRLTEKMLNELLLAYPRTSSVGFPSVCWMYINIPECTKEGDAFFRACEYKLAKIIARMKNPLKCCLHYAMLQRKCCFVDTNSLDQDCLKELRDIFGYKEMTEKSIQDCFGKERKYFSVGQNSGTYTFSQNILYEQCLTEWIGEGRRDRFLLLCNIEQVKENIRDEKYNVQSTDVIIRLKKSEYSKFAPKFASLWKVHEELEYHPLLQNEIFRKHVDDECAKQEIRSQMEEDLTLENETREFPNRSLTDGEKRKGSEDTCTWKSEQPMQTSPQLTLDEKEQEDSPLLNELSV